MPPISNADKQDRFRKKEHLTRRADNIFREWDLSFARHRQSRTPEEVHHALDKLIALPAGWTDEDYVFSLNKLEQYRMDLIISGDQIALDIDGDRVVYSAEFLSTPDPAKFHAEKKAAHEKAKTLAAHLISALKISNCNDADQAAALMEVVRFVGRALVSKREIRRSHATAMCLASIGPQYDRPKWFAEQLAETISQQIDKSLAYEVGRQLSKKS